MDQGFGLATLFSPTLYKTIIAIVSPMLPSFLRFKYAVLMDYILFLVQTFLNHYLSWYMLTLEAHLLGFSFGAVLWTGVYNQLTMVALKLFAYFKENLKYMYLVVLFSFVLIFVELSYILGNLVSCTVLLFNRQEGADGPWVTATCNNTEVASVDETCLHIMLSMCVVPFVAAIVIILFLWTIPAPREELSPCKLRKKHTIWLKGNPRQSKTVGK